MKGYERMKKLQRILAAIMTIVLLLTSVGFTEETQMIELTPEQITELTAEPEETAEVISTPAEIAERPADEEIPTDSEESAEGTIVERIVEPISEVAFEATTEITAEPALAPIPETVIEPTVESPTEPTEKPTIEPTTNANSSTNDIIYLQQCLVLKTQPLCTAVESNLRERVLDEK